MMGEGDLDSKDVVLSDTCTLHIALKSNDGKLYLDARKWYKYPNLDYYVSSKKGLMMELKDWKQIMPLIQGILDANAMDKAA